VVSGNMLNLGDMQDCVDGHSIYCSVTDYRDGGSAGQAAGMSNLKYFLSRILLFNFPSSQMRIHDCGDKSPIKAR